MRGGKTKRTQTAEVARRVRHWRIWAGLSQRELAVETGVTDGAVSGWENGRNAPSHDNLAEIARACGITMARFWSPIRKFLVAPRAATRRDNGNERAA